MQLRESRTLMRNKEMFSTVGGDKNEKFKPQLLSLRSRPRQTLRTKAGKQRNDVEVSVDMCRICFTEWYKQSRYGVYTTAHTKNIAEKKEISPEELQYGWSTSTILSKLDDMEIQVPFVPIMSVYDEYKEIDVGNWSTIYQGGMNVFKKYKLVNVAKDPTGIFRRTDWIGLKLGLRETLIHENMCHPHIIRTYNTQIAMREGFISSCTIQMPMYLTSLPDAIKSPNTISEILRFMKQIGRGLEYMHNVLGVVHSDVKPGNVLLYEGVCYWIDMGLTHFPGHTFENCLGTNIWAAPEKLTRAKNTFASDVWGWGVILLDFLYGQSLMMDIFKLKDDMEILSAWQNVLGDVPPSFRKNYMTKEQQDELFKKSVRGKVPDFVIDIPDKTLEGIQDLLFNHVLCWNPEDRWSMSKIMKHPLFHSILDIESEQRISARSKGVMMFDMLPQTITKSPMVADEVKEFQKWRKSGEGEKAIVEAIAAIQFNPMFTSKQRTKATKDSWYMQQTIYMYHRCIKMLKNLRASYEPKTLLLWCYCFTLFMWSDFSSEKLDPKKYGLFILRFESVMYHLIHLCEKKPFYFGHKI